MKKILTHSFEETQKIGEELAHDLEGHSIIALYGNLGSGKTTFLQGFAKGLGITHKIISPTFIIVRKYKLELRSKPSSQAQAEEKQELRENEKNFYHIDLYRIENEKDVETLGLEEILHGTENIVAIEWPEKIETILPKKSINVYFEYLGENKREITIQK